LEQLFSHHHHLQICGQKDDPGERERGENDTVPDLGCMVDIPRLSTCSAARVVVSLPLPSLPIVSA
jgi:hypothetical protein